MIITDDFVKQYAGKQPNWGFGDLSYVVYKNHYSRKMDNGKKEEFYNTLQRSINGAQEIGADYTQEEAERLFIYMWDLKCLFAGRMLCQLGTETVRKFGANSLLNCWNVAIDSIPSYLFLFENLMLGGGVTFLVKREHIYELPRVKRNVKIECKNTKDADFIVPDSREGWIKLMKNVLTSFFDTGESFNYSTMLIRGYGEEIKTFGGTASGPKPLVDGITDICNKIFKEREGKKLRSIDVLDVGNLIGRIVKSGNVRRSAEMAIGDVDDVLFMNAKRWDNGLIPNWRNVSNNTIECDDINHLLPQFWEGYEGKGEPYGLFNLKLARTVGRLNEKKRDNCEGLNPCGEIPLASYEACNLSEMMLNNISSKEELFDISKLLYKTQKAICNMNYLHEKTNNIVHKNNRIGQSITGIYQSLNKLQWLDDCYNHLKEYDKEYSKQKGWNESIRLTTCQPSGTKSLVTGSTPGANSGYSEYYYRTVRMESSNPLVQYCKDKGYKIEYERNFDGTVNYDTVVIYFPIHLKDSVYAKDITAIQQLEMIKNLMIIWADNSVSITIYYRKEEIPEIKQWLKENYKDSIKSVSFCLHSEHGFDQAVYQEITKEQYEESIKNIKDIKYEEDNDFTEMNIQECEGGSCGLNDIIVK